MNKKLLGNSPIMEVLIDSESLNRELNEGNDDAKKILIYSKHKFLRFVRSPFNTNFEELNAIPEFKKKYNENNLPIIKIVTDTGYKETCMRYNSDFINVVIDELSNSKPLKLSQINALNLFFIQASLNQSNKDNANMLVTNNAFLLKNRLLCYQFTSLSNEIKKHVHIVTVREAREIIGLFLRYNKNYPFCPNFKFNRGAWYESLFISQIPYFRYGPLFDPFNSFASRFIYLFRSIDEIGFQYYMGANNDTMDDMIYHFNYAISLITGIFDSLALFTKNRYQLKFKEDHIPQKTSLNPKAGKEFLKSVKKENSALREYIQNQVNIIKLVYELRELILHRELLNQTHFSSKNWEINAIKIDKSILKYLPKNDKAQKYKPFTNWGLYKPNSEDIFLEPFDFMKALINNVIHFSNEYLKLLGFSNFINEQKKYNPDSYFLWKTKLFKKGSLSMF